VKIIGLSGLAGVGKDTVADFLVGTVENGDNMFVQRYALADPLKKCASEAFGIPLKDFYNETAKEVTNNHWGLTPRYILQILGTEGFREHFGSDIWTRRADMVISQSVTDVFLVTDIRFNNEASWIKDIGGELVSITSPAMELSKKHEHSSERGISVTPDVVIVNDGTLEDLERKVYDEIGRHL